MIHKLLCSHSQGLLLLIYRHTNVCVFAHVCRRLDGVAAAPQAGSD